MLSACKNIKNYLFAFASFYGLNNRSDLYLDWLAKVSIQSFYQGLSVIKVLGRRLGLGWL